MWLNKALNLTASEACEAAHWLCRLKLKTSHAAEALALADQMIPQSSNQPYAPHLLLDRLRQGA